MVKSDNWRNRLISDREVDILIIDRQKDVQINRDRENRHNYRFTDRKIKHFTTEVLQILQTEGQIVFESDLQNDRKRQTERH